MDAREMNQNEELIDLLHLCIYMLKKWKSLLIFLLVGVLLGAAVSLKSVEVRPQADVAMIDSMKLAAEQRKQYNELHKLLTKSPFLALHDVNVYSGSLEYHITDYTDLEHIVEEYFSIQKTPSLKEELCQILDLENDDYFDNFVNVSSKIIADNSDVKKEQDKPQNELVLSVLITSKDEEKTTQALDLVCSKMKDKVAAYIKDTGCTIKETDHSITFGKSAAVQAARNALNVKILQYNDTCANLEKGFNSGEKYAIYQTYALNDKLDELPTILFPESPVKKAVVFAFLSFVLGCAWYFVSYFMNGTIKTVNAAKVIANIPVLGYVNRRAVRKNIIDRTLERMECERENAPVSFEYIAAALSKFDNVTVLYDEQDSALKRFAQEIESKTSVPCMGLLSQNAMTIEKAATDAPVVLLLGIDRTKKKLLYCEMELSAVYNTHVAGMIVLRT